jgi:hypothetical protein
MIYRSSDGELEVSVSEIPDPDGYYSVKSNQISSKDIRAYIEVQFGSKDNSTRIDYKTQDSVSEWTVRGSIRGDVVSHVEVKVLS